MGWGDHMGGMERGWGDHLGGMERGWGDLTIGKGFIMIPGTENSLFGNHTSMYGKGTK